MASLTKKCSLRSTCRGSSKSPELHMSLAHCAQDIHSPGGTLVVSSILLRGDVAHILGRRAAPHNVPHCRRDARVSHMFRNKLSIEVPDSNTVFVITANTTHILYIGAKLHCTHSTVKEPLADARNKVAAHGVARGPGLPETNVW